MEAQNINHAREGDASGLLAHVLQAVDGMMVILERGNSLTSRIGFFRSISLRNGQALQDILRLLTLWFKFGMLDDVSRAMVSGFATIEIDTWLVVIPQVVIIFGIDVYSLLTVFPR